MEDKTGIMEIEITEGQNIIDLIFDDFASCLVVKKPLAINWPDCGGSIGEYYSIADYTTDERCSYTDLINAALSEGGDKEQFEAVKEFLYLFANGKYTVSKYLTEAGEIEFLKSGQLAYNEEIAYAERFSGHFFPHWSYSYDPVIYSITNDKIDPERVAHYCALIRKGIRPTILVFEASNMSSSNYSRAYVLDGHHKIEAYLRLKEDIPVMKIMKTERCDDKAGPLLHAAKKILKEVEYKHLLENNDENLLRIDFANDSELTSDLDKILKNADRIDINIIYVLKKYAQSNIGIEQEWLRYRLKHLKANRYIHLLGFGKGLRVYEQKLHDKHELCWFGKAIKTYSQLSSWIEETIIKSL